MGKRTVPLWLLFFFLFFLISSCTEISRDPYFYGPPVEDGNPVHVFLIGVDGWGSYSLPRADMAEVKRMMAEGASTLNTLNVLPSGSMPNWASLLYGTTPAFHGFTHNTEKPTLPPGIFDEYGYFPGIFALVKKRIPRCQVAAFSEYADILKIIPPEALDRGEVLAGPAAVIEYIRRIDPANPSFTFVHFDEADGAGHAAGHNTPACYGALGRIDGYIKDISGAVEDRGLGGNTVFILTGDHGGIFYLVNRDYTGIFYQHGGNTPEERQVPLIFYGKGIKQGAGISGQVNLYDIAPTIAAIFGLPQPEPWIGRPLREIFAP